MFHVLIINSQIRGQEEVVFEGKSISVLLPGKEGEFEVLDFHKPVITQLKKGYIVVDNMKEFLIRGGVAKIDNQRLVAMVDV